MTKLDKAIKNLRKAYGNGTIMDLRKNEPVLGIRRVPIDSPKIGNAFGDGGYPLARITEIFGPESGGKTSLAEYISGQFQRHNFQKWDEQGEVFYRKGIVLYIDVEHALDPDHAEAQGFLLSQSILAQPDSGEQAFEIAIKMAETGEVDLIVIDSLAAMTPIAEIEAEMTQQQMGAQARLIGKGLRKLSSIISENECSLILINQIRDKFGAFYAGTKTTPGGHAPKFYSSVRIEVRRREYIMDKDEVVGIKIALKTVKNKTAPPMRKYIIDMYFATGFDATMEWIDFAIQYDIIKKAGGWFTLPGHDKPIQGKSHVIDYLKEKDHEEEYNIIIEKTRVLAFPKKKSTRVSIDSIEDEALIKKEIEDEALIKKEIEDEALINATKEEEEEKE